MPAPRQNTYLFEIEKIFVYVLLFLYDVNEDFLYLKRLRRLYRKTRKTLPNCRHRGRMLNAFEIEKSVKIVELPVRRQNAERV